MILATAFLTAMLAVLAVIDWRTYRIPDWLSLPLLAGGLLWQGLRGQESLVTALIGASVGYLVLATFGSAFFRLRGREGLGLGDAKLFAAGGAWLGWQALPLVLLLAAGGGLACALATRLATRAPGGEIAFGPWLAASIWGIWMFRVASQLGT